MMNNRRRNRCASPQEISFDMPIQARPDLLWREVDGEIVLLDPKQGHYYALEGSGTRLWKLLQEKTTLGNILFSFLNEYEVEEKMLRQDLVGVYKRLNKFGLLQNI
jgi:hypothetical protein